MPGRPKRVGDLNLVETLANVLAEKGSTMSACARDIGVSTSTLSRSMSSKAFSTPVRLRVERFLAQHNRSGACQKLGERRSRQSGNSVEESLQVLQKFVETIPDVRNAINALLAEKKG